MSVFEIFFILIIISIAINLSLILTKNNLQINFCIKICYIKFTLYIPNNLYALFFIKIMIEYMKPEVLNSLYSSPVLYRQGLKMKVII